MISYHTLLVFIFKHMQNMRSLYQLSVIRRAAQEANLDSLVEAIELYWLKQENK